MLTRYFIVQYFIYNLGIFLGLKNFRLLWEYFIDVYATIISFKNYFNIFTELQFIILSAITWGKSW